MSRRMSSASRMSTSRMSSIFPVGHMWSSGSPARGSLPRLSSAHEDEEEIMQALSPSLQQHNDFSRPILSQRRDSLGWEPPPLQAPVRGTVGNSQTSFGQLLAAVASEHEREVSALQEQLEMVKRQKVSRRRNSTCSMPPDDLLSEEAEPPPDRQPQLEKHRESGIAQDGPRPSLLGVPGTGSLWRPTSSDAVEPPSPKRGGASPAEVPPLLHDVPGSMPCQVIKVTPEAQPQVAGHLRVSLAHQVDATNSEVASSVSHSSSTAHHRQTSSQSDAPLNSRKFAIRSIWEQLSDEAHPHGMFSKRLSYESLSSDLSIQDGTLLSRLVTHPSSNFRLVWNSMALLMLASDLVTVPLQLFEPPANSVESVLEIVTLIFWNLDIFANFFVGYYEQGAAVMSPRRIALQYLRSWFLLDLTLVTVDWVLICFVSVGAVGGSRAGRAMKVLRAMRYLRLLRLLKTKHMLAKTQVLMSEISSVRFSIGKLFAAILIINHLIGCFWWGVGSLQCEGRSWTYEFQDRGLAYRYLTSFHWSISQFGVGNVEIEAESTCERIFCIFVLLFALIAFSSLISSITNAMAHLRRLNDRDTQLALFSRYCHEQRISSQLMNRMIQHINAVLDQQRQSIAAVDVTFLKLLSEPLFDELQKEIYESYLRVHPFFGKLCTLYVACTRALCRRSLTTMYLAPRDLLFHPCQVAHRMYFVEGGQLRYSRTQYAMTSVEVGPPEWFGEAVLWTRWLYYGHMQALGPCELVALGSEQFQDCIKMHPETLRVLKRYARRFVEKLNATYEADLTDLSSSRNTQPFVRADRQSEVKAAISSRLGWRRFVGWWGYRTERRGSDESTGSVDDAAVDSRNTEKWSDAGSEEADDNAHEVQ